MEIYGHRGARGEAPENTIAGCRHAIDAGIRRIEIDLRTSSDGELVVLHDETLERTTGAAGRPADYPLAKLAELDARGPYRRLVAGALTGVPSLAGLLDATPEIEHYQLEVKPDCSAVLQVIAQRLADRFPPQTDSSRVAVTSSSIRFLHMIRDAAPHLARGLVAAEADFQQPALEAECSLVCPHYALCSPELVRQLQANGMHVSAWTVNESGLAERMRDWAVDSIITDFPSRMQALAIHGNPA